MGFCGFSLHFPYVAVVSDNDGSAFITKAEFDSLKNNFQAQIDNYNQSIDSKIDGAIASYLAGIKVNTDDTPVYRVFGTDQGIYLGVKVNGFYLIGLSGGPFGDETNYFISVEGTTRSNRGYGYGLWAHNAFNKGGSYTITGIPANSFALLSGGSGISSGHISYVKSTEESRDSRRGTIDFSSFPNGIRDICTIGISDVFQTLIPIYKPEIPLYEFLDSGEVSVQVAKISNGANYEAGAHGGRDTDLNPAKTKPKFYLNHNGIKTDLLLDGAMTDLQFSTINTTVAPGDRIYITPSQDSTSIWTSTYSIYYYQNNIAGWRIETT